MSNTTVNPPPTLGGHLIVLGVSTVVFGAALYLLVTVRFYYDYLVPLYLTYAVSSAVFLHAVFFTWNKVRRLSKSVPRYLDYAYVSVILLGLVQVVSAAPKVADYLTLIHADEPALKASETDLIADIVKTAKGYVDDECVNVGTRTTYRFWFGLGSRRTIILRNTATS